MEQYTLMAMCLGRHGDSTTTKHVHCPEKMHRLGINRKETLGATGWPRRPENGRLNSVSAFIWGGVNASLLPSLSTWSMVTEIIGVKVKHLQ